MAEEQRHLLFVPTPHGYELVERNGEVPAVGTEIEVEGETSRYLVTKVAPSPFPGDARRCAYLQHSP
jgi:hypothetical protein